MFKTVLGKLASAFKAMWNSVASFSLYGFWGWAGGRSFVLAAYFAATAFWLAKHNLLTKEYAGAMIAIQGFATWRTVHEDKKEVAMRGEDRQDSVAESTSDRKDTAQADQNTIALRGQDRKDASSAMSDVKTAIDGAETAK
jgi:hypothetical protein